MTQLITATACHYCGELADTVDHVIPRLFGGTDDPGNRVPACTSCNSAKGTLPVELFGANEATTRQFLLDRGWTPVVPGRQGKGSSWRATDPERSHARYSRAAAIRVAAYGQIAEPETPTSTIAWASLAEAVVVRRVELGMRTRSNLAKVSGLTVKTLGEIERNERTSYDRSTLATIEHALCWAPGTIRAILSGETGRLGPAQETSDSTGSHVGLSGVARLIDLLDPLGPLPPMARRHLATAVDGLVAAMSALIAPANAGQSEDKAA